MKKNKNRNAIISMILLALILFLRDIININIDQIIILGVISIIAAVLSYEDLMMFTAFFIPLLTGVNTISALIVYILLILKAKKRYMWQFLPMVVLVIINLLHLFLHDSYSILDFSIVLANFGLFFWYIFDKNDIDISKVIKSFCWGVIILLVMINVSVAITQGGIMALVSSSDVRVGATYGGQEAVEGITRLALNANSLSLYSIIVISILLAGREKLEIDDWEYWTLFVISFIAGAITLGRTWMLCLFASLLYMLLFATRHEKRPVYLALMGLILGFIFFPSFFDNLYEQFLGRFQDDTLETGGGRTVLFSFYNNLWISKADYILLGIGPSYRSDFSQYNAMHNATQQLYVTLGVFGFMNITIAILKALKKYAINHDASKLLFLPSLVALLYYQSIPLLGSYVLLIPFAFCIYIFRLSVNSN